MRDLAPVIWPPEKRKCAQSISVKRCMKSDALKVGSCNTCDCSWLTVFLATFIAAYCYSERKGDIERDCNAKDGNPFGPFWDTFSIDFNGSEFHRGLSYSTHLESARKQWEKR